MVACARAHHTPVQLVISPYFPGFDRRVTNLDALKIAVEAWEFHQKQIQECDRALQPLLERMAEAKPAPELGERKELRNNAPRSMPNLREQMGQIDGADLARIPGLNEYTLMQLLAEVGVDMSPWGGVKPFTAWLGLAPASRQSGQRKRREKRHGGMAGRIFCLAAQSMARAKKSWLGSFYRRLSATRGKAVALKATARKIATLFYLVLTKGWTYVEQGLEKYEQEHRQRQLRRLQALARELEVDLPKTARA